MIQRHALDIAELNRRIAASRRRLCESYYGIDEVFQPKDADWPGDKEGRALLAFVSHYKMTGDIIPCMPAFMERLESETSGRFFFGPDAGSAIFEQQLSGHSWLLRGLCEHYEQFGDELSRKALMRVVEGVFLPTKGHYTGYPVNRAPDGADGGVSGHSTGSSDGWLLSTDTGCAFMAIDGLSHAYKVTKDARILSLLNEMITVFSGIDKAALKVQTHCTLTAARGMTRLFALTGNPGYLVAATDIFNLYAFGYGMDAVYQNLNWWGRADTWTEPCAIVDSLMLGGELYRFTGKDMYRRFAARVYANGFASAQRPNGGAGTDSIVFHELETGRRQNDLYMLSYEAPFCCTMRFAEGLWYVWKNASVLYAEAELDKNGRPVARRDEWGRYMCGDYVLTRVELTDGRNPADVLPKPLFTAETDGLTLTPPVKYFELPDDVLPVLRQRVLF